VNAKIVTRDNGADALIKALKGAAKVSVGIHETEGAQAHEGEELTIAEIGSIHEFGAPAAGIPQRSFIRDWFDESQADNEATLRNIGRGIAQGKVESVDQGLDMFGAKAAGDVQKRMRDGIEPALDDKTIERKGSSTPLIDKGQLFQAVTWKVDK
jgi:hypothetical protein